MKNILIAVLILIVGFGAYSLVKQSKSEGYVANGALEYIPADTAIFAGTITPFPILDYLQSISSQQQPKDIEREKLSSPQTRFLAALYDQYQALSNKPKELLAAFGLADHLQAYMYSMGLIPVIKVQLNQADAFMAQLDLAEKSSGLHHKNLNYKGYNYRSYPFVNGKDLINLIIGEHKGWLTITLARTDEDPSLLEQTLGLKPVANNITQSAKLEDLVKRHGLLKELIVFVNHQAIANALTKGSGELGQQLTAILTKQSPADINLLRSPVCQQEFTNISNNWPMTLLGLQNLNVNKQQSNLNFKLIIESNNQTTLTALKNLQGVIYPFLSKFDESIISFNIGLNTDNLASSIQQFWQQINQPQLQCLPLANLQRILKRSQPNLIGVLAGMAQGANGLSLVLKDYTPATETQPAQIDALINLSVDNPKNLFAIASTFLPKLASIQLPDDGTAIDLTQYLSWPFGGKIEAAVKGKNIVFFTGTKSKKLSEQLANAKSLNNGELVNMYADYQQLYPAAVAILNAFEQGVPVNLIQLKNNPTKIQFDLTVSDQGIIISNRINHQSSGNK